MEEAAYHRHSGQHQRILLVLLLTTVFMGIEALAGWFVALSAHVIVPKGQDRDVVLHERFGIGHLTLQIVEEREEYIHPQ